MQSCLGEERSWETNSGAPLEPQLVSVPDWSDEVDAQPGARSEDDEDTGEFLSPAWD
jgi:hypothetical protein